MRSGVFLLLVSAAPGWAAPGDLDPAFGKGGKVVTHIGRTDYISGLTLDQNRILLSGTAASQPSADFVVARYKGDGRLDPRFGAGGSVRIDLSGTQSYDWAAGLAVTLVRKVVVGGWTFSNDVSSDIALVRLTQSGKLDRSFGRRGLVTSDVSGQGSIDYAWALSLQPDGKIVLAGESNARGSYDLALARYRSDGTLDPKFGVAGKVLVDLGGAQEDDHGAALVIQDNGRIVAAGSARTMDTLAVALARFLPNGRLDPSFGQGGVVLTDLRHLGFNHGAARGLAVQPDGKIVVVGTAELPGMGSMSVLARYTADGGLDPEFGSAGIAEFHGTTTTVTGYAVRVQADGNLVTVGPSYRITPSGFEVDFAVARFLPDGRLDPLFGAAGVVRTAFRAGSLNFPFVLAADSNGKLLVGGNSSTVNRIGFALARYLP